MGKTITTAVFDGRVLHPESTIDLEANRRYIVTIEQVQPELVEGDVWDVLETLAGAVEAPPDWAEEHDR